MKAPWRVCGHEAKSGTNKMESSESEEYQLLSERPIPKDFMSSSDSSDRDSRERGERGNEGVDFSFMITGARPPARHAH